MIRPATTEQAYHRRPKGWRSLPWESPFRWEPGGAEDQVARSKAIARSQGKTVLAMLDDIAEKMLTDVAGLYKNPGDKGYNPDATVPWTEATTKTRASLIGYQQVMANSREQVRGAVALGVVAMQRAMSKDEWERKAKIVDDEAKQGAIDAVATSVNDVMDLTLVTVPVPKP